MPSKPVSLELLDPELRQALGRFMDKASNRAEKLRIEPIPADGSTRTFWRLHRPSGDPSLVVMINPPADPTVERENRAYLKIGRHLKEKGIPVPQIYAHSLEGGWFIMEDLGNRTLQEVALDEKTDPLPIYRDVLEGLVHLQLRGAEEFDPSWCGQTAVYNTVVMRRYESDYFRNAFLRGYMGIKGLGSTLEPAFAHLAEKGSKADCRFFLHRDFQSRNILVSGKKIGFVDWQGGRMGPLAYDLASLLIDPYTDLPSRHKDPLYAAYLGLIHDVNPRWAESLDVYYPYLAIQRNLQILGAFSYLTETVQKPRFAAYIPGAVTSLNHLLGRVGDLELLPLKDLMGRVTERIRENKNFRS
ncbi:MAG: phosphotransferase [Deltaproteobacteria bacterium]